MLRSPLVRAALAGLALGAAVIAVVAVRSESADRSRRRRSADASAPFLAAWRRSLETTWVVTYTFERTTRAGGHLVAERRVAQRPPDRLSSGLGSVGGRRGDHAVTCAADANGVDQCGDAGPAPPYGDEVAHDIDVLRGQVEGPDRLYRVTRPSPSCYVLTLVVSYPVPPYGRSARYCFDRRLGAPVVIEVHRPEGSDVQRAVSVTGDVTDADFDPNQP